MDNAIHDGDEYPYGGIMAYLKYNFIDGVVAEFTISRQKKTRYIHKSDNKKITVFLMNLIYLYLDLELLLSLSP